MSYDELELDKLGDEKTALFFCISDTDSTYNFIVALAFSQMFNLLCEKADNVYGGRLPHHVRVLWDEAANTGQVPQLEKIVAVIRSREISLCLFYQAMSQCKALYKDNSETILGNMDSVIFLGGTGKRDNLHVHREPDAGPVGKLRPEPSAARQGADDNGRADHHAGKQVHFTAPGPAPVFLAQV